VKERIRRATVADVDGVVELVAEVAAEGKWLATEIPFDRSARVERMCSGIETGRMVLFIAENPDGRIVGELSLWLSGPRAELGMAIAREARGYGLGRAMMKAALDWADANGVTHTELTVLPDNAIALALYRNTGFVETEYRPRALPRRSGEVLDLIAMRRTKEGRRDATPRFPER
jgi:RimJ/RimL family protein N-acetyltransferase